MIIERKPMSKNWPHEFDIILKGRNNYSDKFKETELSNLVTTINALPGIDVYTFIGDMNSTKRDQVVRIFNKSREPRVILVSLIAGGTGLSLHYGSSTVLMCEPCYNPFAEKQAEERVHRLGQDTQVNIYKYRLTEGVENWMEGLKKKKLKIASTLGMTKKNLVSDDFAFSEVERLFSEHVSFTG